MVFVAVGAGECSLSHKRGCSSRGAASRWICLEQSLSEIVRRHEALRTTFKEIEAGRCR